MQQGVLQMVHTIKMISNYTDELMHTSPETKSWPGKRKPIVIGMHTMWARALVLFGTATIGKIGV